MVLRRGKTHRRIQNVMHLYKVQTQVEQVFGDKNISGAKAMKEKQKNDQYKD